MKQRTRNALAGLLFISPWIIGFLVFTLYPLLETLRYSVSKVRIQTTGVTTEFIGLVNFKQVLLQDPDFMVQVPGYLQQIFLLVPMSIVFSVLLSILLNQSLAGRRFFRAVFFLPVILMCGPLLTNILELDATTLEGVREFVIYKFIDDYFPQLLAAPLLYIFDNIILILWFCGVQILIFLSGLQKIDRSVYAAAMVDGASAWQQFWKITLPTLKPFILLNAIYAIVDVSSSSLNTVTKVIKDGMFAAAKGSGFSAAAGYIYFLFILIFILCVYLLLGHGEYRERKALKNPKRRVPTGR